MANQFESILTKIGEGIVTTLNVSSNLLTAEMPVIDEFVPKSIADAINANNLLFRTTFAGVEAKYAAIGKTNVPFGEKVAEVLAITGPSALYIFAGAGLTLPQSSLTAVEQGAANAAGVVSSGTITQLPAAPATGTTPTVPVG